MSVQLKTIKTNGFSMDCLQFGRGERSLVIIPGLSVQSVMGAADAVADAYSLLAHDFTVYLFDRRKDIPTPYSIRQMALDTAAAIDAAGLERVSLFGASQGGMIAMEIAAMYPETVDSLILGSTSAVGVNCSAADEWAALAKKGDAKALYLSFGEKVYPKSIFEQSRDMLITAAESVTPDELARFVTLAKSILSFDFSEGLKNITCPTLVIGDTDDRIFGAAPSKDIASALVSSPRAELFIYDGYGHAAYDTAPDYKERMLKFLLS